jgi:uncharacterized protein YcfL
MNTLMRFAVPTLILMGCPAPEEEPVEDDTLVEDTVEDTDVVDTEDTEDTDAKDTDTKDSDTDDTDVAPKTGNFIFDVDYPTCPVD